MGRTVCSLLLLLWTSWGSAFELHYVEPAKLSAPADLRTSASVDDALPDVVVTEGAGWIRRAWLVFPSRRYDHAILGDGVEAAGIRVELDSSQRLTFLLPDDSVFEDRFPRLVDLDSDGVDEIVLVRSYLEHGSALMVLKVKPTGIEPLAESLPIGLAHRWLNPVGVADFDNDGQKELAVVTTPHIGGNLTLYRINRHRLELIHRMPGFSNHRIGSRELGQSAVVDVNGDGVTDLVVPATGFHELRLISVVNGALKELNLIKHSSPISSALNVRDLDGDGDQDLSYGLSDGRRVELLLP